MAGAAGLAGLAFVPEGYTNTGLGYEKLFEIQQQREALAAFGRAYADMGFKPGAGGLAGLGGMTPPPTPTTPPPTAPPPRVGGPSYPRIPYNDLAGGPAKEAAAIKAGTWTPADDYGEGLNLSQGAIAAGPPAGGTSMGAQPGASYAQIFPDTAPVGSALTPPPSQAKGPPMPASPGGPPGGAGGPAGAAPGAPPAAAPARPAGAAGGTVPPFQGPPTWQDIANRIAQANPNIRPETLARAIQLAVPMMQADSRQWYQMLQAEIQRERMGTQREIAGENISSREKIAGENIASRETIAAQPRNPQVMLALKKVQENPDITAEQLRDFLAEPGQKKVETQQAGAAARTQTQQAGAIARTQMQQEGATGRTQLQQEGATARTGAQIQSREGIAAAGRESREGIATAGRESREGIAAANRQSRENVARQALEFKTEAFNRSFEQRDRIAADKIKVAREKLEAGQVQPGDIENVAQGIAHYQQAPYVGTAARSGMALRVMKRVYEIAKEEGFTYDQANWRSHSDALTRFTSGPQANTIRSIKVADDHLKTVGNLALTLANGDTKSFNTVKNFLQKQLGYPEVPSFEAARQIVAAEVIKAVSATGGGVAERLQAQQPLDPNASLPAIQSAIRTYRKLMAGQIMGFQEQYDAIPGSPKDFKERFKYDAAKLREEAAEPAAPAGDAAPEGDIKFKWVTPPAGP
jgi:hypothetical protein